jgi:biotin carboxylase
MGSTATLSFRDKLRMSIQADAAGIPVPEFTPLVNDAAINDFAARVPAPWILKPRGSAATMGIRRVQHATELWPMLDALGDQRSHHVLARFIEGDVFHVDGIVADGKLVFAEANAYARPPFEVTRGGGMFMSRTLDRDGDSARVLVRLAGQLVTTLGLARGAIHAEFIRGREAGDEPRFIEIAARVGGAHIAEMVEAATGINLWREWASVELANVRGEKYQLPATRRDFAGIIVSLARQEWPDDSSFEAPEIVWRMKKKHHIGMIFRSDGPQRIAELQQQYGERIGREYSAFVPET